METCKECNKVLEGILFEKSILEDEIEDMQNKVKKLERLEDITRKNRELKFGVPYDDDETSNPDNN